MTLEDKYLAPEVTGDTIHFWEGCRQHEFRLQKCRDCGSYQNHPRPFCGECYETNIEWVTSSGRGTVWTFTITKQHGDPRFAWRVPFVLAYVELEEGVKVMTNIVDTPPESVYIGMPVEVTFVEVTPELSIYQFRPRM
jgi:uncharacterized OB-fold protein